MRVNRFFARAIRPMQSASSFPVACSGTKEICAWRTPRADTVTQLAKVAMFTSCALSMSVWSCLLSTPGVVWVASM